MTAAAIEKRLRAMADPERAKILQGFFKTGPGQYAEGDVFLGLYVPQVRRLAAEYRALPLPEAVLLLRSPLHEARLLALLLLIRAYDGGDEPLRERIFDLYLRHTRFINNWDLVDASAEHIVGRHLRDRSRDPIRLLATSDLLWDRRIAVLATFHYIKRGEFGETLAVARQLLGDREDLIHKAVGWMLREVGKRDGAAEEAFLRRHSKTMPRTMLRYAVERFPEERRQAYLRGEMSAPEP